MLSTTSSQLINTQSAFEKQDVIERLVELDSKNKILLNPNVSKEDLLTIKIKAQQDLDRLRKLFRLFKILAIVCFAMPAIIYLIKIFDQTVVSDFNKVAFILLMVSNLLLAHGQHVRIKKLEQQIILLDFLQNVDT